MKRRHLVVIVSAFTLLTILFVGFVTVGVGVGTDPGREQIRALVQQQVNNRVKGKVHIGRVSSLGPTSITIDSFAIRDTQDSLLVSMGRITARYDVRDLMDRRILLRNVEIRHPVFRLRQHEEGDWNFQRLLRRDGPSAPNVPGRSFGDYVVLDSVRVVDGEFILTRPWSPDDSLRGAKRDSAIRVNMANPDREIRRSAEGLTHTYRWSRASAVLARVRIADPDSAGQLFVIDSMHVDEFEPPFRFRNGRGVVRKSGDSVFFDVAHFDLPASTGSARGKIWWGSALPVRLDIRIKADSVSLNDVSWVYATLPRVGGGRTNLRITNNREDLHNFEYALTDMDVRSTKSRLSGGMTFVVGGPVLVVKDVDLRAAPVNFDLVRTLAGEPLPQDWQGDLYGIVRGPGGPLTRFRVDTSFVTFRDAHVRGAISQLSGRGMLNIVDPELTEFRGFDVNAVSLDLRTLEYLIPGFPLIGGTISGVATLDSSWMDVRFSNANVTHRNGPGEPTRATGAGRVTYGEQFLTYDVALNVEPLSLTMMSRAYPLGLKGLMSGPIQAKGTTNDLQVTAQLEGRAGRFSYSGIVDLYPLSVAARGTGRLDALDLAQVIDKPKTPAGFVTGSYQLDVRGDTNDLGTLRGSAGLTLERSELDGIRVFPSRLRARFADGRMYVDTLRVESVAATVTASGALGLTRRTQDSLEYSVTVDSLGGLRRYVTRISAKWRPAASESDSLSGVVRLQGTARGSLQSLHLSGQIDGQNLYVKREAGREITGSFSLADVLAGPEGTFKVRFNAINLGRIILDTLGAEVRLDPARRGAFTLGALARNGVTLVAGGDLAMANGETNVVLRAVDVATDSGSWRLARPSSVRLRDSTAVTIDSLLLTNGRGGRIALAGFVADTGRAGLALRADSLPLRDIGQIVQLRAPLAGWAHVSAIGSGTSVAPVMNVQTRLADVRYGGIKLERINGTAEYANRRALVALDLRNEGRPALVARGSLPIELNYFGGQLLDDSLRATVRTDSASLSLIEALLPVRVSSGRLVANLDVTGTWKHPDVTGPVRVESGEIIVDSLGIAIHDVNVDIGFFGHRDSLAVRRVYGWSGAAPSDSVSIRGYAAYRDLDNPYVDLTLAARTFQALDRRTLARLSLSTQGRGLRLRGQLRGASLTGGIVVDRGLIFMPDPELARKQRDYVAVRDTAVTTQGSNGGSRMFESILFDDVRVSFGDEVWLRSRDVNIKLGGVLDVQQRAEQVAGVSTDDLIETDSSLVPVLDGELRAERGTYTLDLGGLVRREFLVEGGTITYYASDNLPDQLDVRALHTVRKADGSSVRIRVRLTGPLENPIVSLESAESYTLSQSDLVSYLIFGQQNFELGTGRQSYVQLAAQTLLPSATPVAASYLRGVLGPFSNFLQLRPGSADPTLGEQGQGLKDIFWSSQVGGEKQVTEKLFVSVSTGLCQFQGKDQNGSNSDVLGFFDGLSGKLEYRFSRDASVKVGKEPAGSMCKGASAGRVVAPPSQWGLSLFKTWRF